MALVGASLMVAGGGLSLEDAYKAVDFNTMTLLLGTMESEVEYAFACNTARIVYRNLSASTVTVNIGVQEKGHNCNGRPSVQILDSNRTVLTRISFEEQDGVVSLSVGASQQVQVFCDGGDDPSGCKWEVSI